MATVQAFINCLLGKLQLSFIFHFSFVNLVLEKTNSIVEVCVCVAGGTLAEDQMLLSMF